MSEVVKLKMSKAGLAKELGLSERVELVALVSFDGEIVIYFKHEDAPADGTDSPAVAVTLEDLRKLS